MKILPKRLNLIFIFPVVAVLLGLVFIFNFINVTNADAVRGTSGDFWADKVLGQLDFTEGTRNEKTAFKVNNPGGALMDRGTHPNTLYVSDSANSRILVYKSLGVCHNDGSTACTSDDDCPGSTCDLNTNKGADHVLGQPDFTRSACNGDSGYQTYPAFPVPSASTLCGMPPIQTSPLEGGSFQSFAVDSNHNLYFPDWLNNRVLMYSNPADGSSGQSATVVWGQALFSDYQCNRGQDAPSDNTLCLGVNDSYHDSFGMGVDVDSAGNLWVADSLNNRVLRFPYDSGLGHASSTADLVLGQQSMDTGNGGQGSCDHFNNSCSTGSDCTPYGSCVGGTTDIGRFCISDGDCDDGTCSLNPPVCNIDEMSHPTAVRVDTSGNVYVADTGNNRILFFSKDNLVDDAAGTIWGSGGIGFNNPTGIEFDVQIPGDANSGGIWINDEGNHMIELWDTAGTTVKKVINEDEYNPSDRSPDSPSCLSSIGICYQDTGASIGISSSDDLFTISDGGNQNVIRYHAPIPTPTYGELVRADYNLYGIQAGGYNYLSGKGLLGPDGVAVYDNGDTHQLIVGDTDRILYWNNPLDAANGSLASGVVGVNDFNSSNPLYGRIAIDKSGHLYVAHNYDIEIYDLPLVGNNQSPIATISGRSLKDIDGEDVNPISLDNISPDGLYPSSDGNYLWVAYNFSNRVVRIRNPITDPQVDVVLGQTSISGVLCNQSSDTPSSSEATNSTLCAPGAVTIDNYGNIYVSDNSLELEGNARLLEYNASDFPADSDTTVFDVPADNIVINDRHVFQPAFDSNNNMVVGYNSMGEYQNSNHSLDYFTGVPAHITYSGEFNDFYAMPYSITFDSSNNMFVADINRWKIMIYKDPLAGIPTPTESPTETPTATPVPTESPTPTPEESSLTTDNNSPFNSNVGAPSCGNTIGPGTPDLYEIMATKNSATLYFAPPYPPYSSFYISYSSKPGIWQYGVEFPQGYSNGAIKYTIYMLQPVTKYYFTVRSGNGCATGNWSNTAAVTTVSKSSSKSMFYYENTGVVVNQILNYLSSIIKPTEIIQPTSTASPTFQPVTTNTYDQTQTETTEAPSSTSTLQKFCLLWWCF
ncbi:MAG: hypothetical protein ABSC49_02695 [Candidatus Microgenomates bacterium]